MFPGSIANKLDNEYERKRTVYNLLQVIEGRATSLRYEGVSEDCRGFELALYRPDHVEW